MAAELHPTAVVDPSARLADGVRVGAYAWIGADVELGAGTVIHHHAVVEGPTVMGPRCEVFPFACIGMKTQDLKYKGGRPGTVIGADNVFREFATVHAATAEPDVTRIGDGNYFLAYGHVAHDCVIGNGIIASNNTTLAGHVVVEDNVVIGGFGAVHQFCRLGTRCMLGGCSKIIQDVPPYLVADGNPASIRAINKVGLERAGFGDEQMSRIKRAFRILYRDGHNRAQAVKMLENDPEADSTEIRHLLGFIAASERGLTPGGRG
ncbi:MAG: acyl-ACP--UDP-N-acetylglucosamine O-acyltransferase [Puniceicoccaceae bacterium]|nr:MAG: acyl-ACP--UDP-N-acetylglucosamine O-acyltransferase [Puniceicoccaceae bacterium]